ncbi:MAG: hypothetical protein HY900_00420 [Deltaproteobacteria bacterium]|nr:hypothetical protein [Deltaproteobacteria bacterium]
MKDSEREDDRSPRKTETVKDEREQYVRPEVLRLSRNLAALGMPPDPPYGP